MTPGCTHAAVDVPEVSHHRWRPATRTGSPAGVRPQAVLRRLHEVGCAVTEPAEPAAGGPAAVLAAGPALPVGPGRGGHPAGGLREHPRPDCAGHGRPRPHGQQRLRRDTGRALAEAGYAEVLSHPFSSARRTMTGCSWPPDDPRRRAPRIANPLNDDEPLLRTTLLPGLLRVLVRNIGRGFGDIGLFESGRVFFAPPGGPRVAPILPVDRGPTAEEVATLDAALPGQPLHIAAVLTGERELGGWWGAGRRPAGRTPSKPPGTCCGKAGLQLRDPRRPGRALAPGPVRGAVPAHRRWAGVAGRPRRGTAPAGPRARSACPPGPARWSWTCR